MPPVSLSLAEAPAREMLLAASQKAFPSELAQALGMPQPSEASSLSLSSCDSFPPTLIDKGCGLRTLSLTAEAELDAGAGLGSCTRDV